MGLKESIDQVRETAGAYAWVHRGLVEIMGLVHHHNGASLASRPMRTSILGPSEKLAPYARAHSGLIELLALMGERTEASLKSWHRLVSALGASLNFRLMCVSTLGPNSMTVLGPP